jgi:hypothetical protein
MGNNVMTIDKYNNQARGIRIRALEKKALANPLSISRRKEKENTSSWQGGETDRIRSVDIKII